MYYRNKIVLITFIFILLCSIPISAEKTNEEMYSNMPFRNPFLEYVEPQQEPEKEKEKIITFEDVKREIPFKLNGIIANQKEKIALIDTGSGVEFISNFFEKNGYQITEVYNDGIFIKNRGFQFYMRIGGEINER